MFGILPHTFSGEFIKMVCSLDPLPSSKVWNSDHFSNRFAMYSLNTNKVIGFESPGFHVALAPLLIGTFASFMCVCTFTTGFPKTLLGERSMHQSAAS